MTALALAGCSAADDAERAEARSTAVAPSISTAPEAQEPSAASTTEQRGESIVILTSVSIADEPGAEVIATGDVLDGSTLGGSPFCVGGTILDVHGSTDPERASRTPAGCCR